MKNVSFLLCLMFILSNSVFIHGQHLTNKESSSNFSCMIKKKATNYDNTACPAPIRSISEDKSGRMAYGYLVYSITEPKKGLCTFDITSPNKIDLLYPEHYSYTAFAGAYANGKYYASLFIDIMYIPLGLYEYDIETGESIKLSDWGNMKTTFNDMSYDYSTDKMYAVMSLNNDGSTPNPVSNLYTIDITNGNYTSIVPLDRYFFTLACTYKGQLYGISSSGELCEINKTTGAVKVVGNTGIVPKFSQSMEFDHQTQILYWAAQNDNLETLCKVDCKNGQTQKIGDLGGSAQICGLYIPFQITENDDAPNLISNLQATPGDNGTNTATLTWKNPSTNFVGSPLTELTGVKIYRTNTLLATVSNGINIGENSIWTDSEAPLGMVEYKVVPYNSKGDGLVSSINTYVGKDKPGTVQNINILKEGYNLSLTWTEPATGLNGGWYDKYTLKYTVTRHPDNIVVADKISATQFTDVIVALNSYSYTITASNAEGIGLPITSNSIVVGPSLTVPYSCNFSTKESFEVWSNIDGNGDGSKWQYNHGSVAYTYNRGGANDWLISAPIYMEVGSYKLNLDFWEKYSGVFEKLKIAIGEGVNITDLTTQLADFPYIVNLYSETREVIIDIKKTGEYNLGFNVYSDGDQGDLVMSNIKLVKFCDNDLAVVELKGSPSPVQNRKSNYIIKVKNVGKMVQRQYQVKLIDADDNTLASFDVNEEILPQQEKDVLVKFSPTIVGEMKIRGRVILTAGDCNEANDTSPDVTVTVLSSGSSEEVVIGVTNYEERWTRAPFYFDSKNQTMAQTIYQSDEIGLNGGIIEKIKYLYTSNAEQEVSGQIKVWLANTKKMDLDEGWIPENEFILVYDQPRTFVSAGGGGAAGSCIIEIVFDTPFSYTGENLCIMTETVLTTAAKNSTFSATTTRNTANRSRAWESNSYFPVNTFGPDCGMTNDATPNITISIKTSGGGIISGIVKDEFGSPIKGVCITMETPPTVFETDAYGEYEFLQLDPEKQYKLTFSKVGYEDVVKSDISVSIGETKVDVIMNSIQSYQVSGKLLDSEGTPIGKAKVELIGYDKITVMSDATTGEFKFDKVYKSDNYTIKVTSDIYEEYTASVNVVDQAVVIPDITLNDKLLTVGNVKSKLNIDKSVKIEWLNPSKLRLFRKDDGTIKGHSGSSAYSDNMAEKAVLGTVYRGAAKLYRMSWLTQSYQGPHNSVNVFVFDLDTRGMPTKNILYSKMNVPNTDMQWSTFEFPELVEAPNGFMIAISYAGYVALASDTGKDLEYPFVENTNFYSSDYTIGYFQSAEVLGNIRANFLMRADGVIMGDDNIKSLIGYDLYRFKAENVGNESVYDKLARIPASETAHVDNTWNDLDQGTYMYGVKAIYSGNKSSKAVVSNPLEKDMITSVTIQAKTNTTQNEIAGASITMQHKTNNNIFYTKEFTTSGIVKFSDITKGIYSVVVTKFGFEKYVQDMDFSKEATYTPTEIILIEMKSKPFNLMINTTADQSERIFSWNYIKPIEDGFEEHDDFVINSPGELGWSYIDVDELNTYGFANYTFPTMEEKMAYVVMNPSNMEPPLVNSNTQAHTGDKYLGCLAAVEGANNDYLISPKLEFPVNCEVNLKFWAKSMQKIDGNESMMLGYSLTDKNATDFIWLTTDAIKVPFEWTEYSYVIPNDAKYITIRCVSNYNFMLMIDDVSIGAKTSRSVVEYEVFLDGATVGKTKNTSYTFKNLLDGNHNAGVKTIYSSGESEISTISFNVITDGVDESTDLKLSIYPNPVKDFLNVVGDYSSLIIYDAQGREVLRQDNMMSSIDVSSLSDGLYVIKANDMEKIGIYKVVIKK